MEIVNKLPYKMFLNIKDVIAVAFKFNSKDHDRAKYIVKRIREIYDNISYNFCCLVLDRRLTNQDWGLYFSYMFILNIIQKINILFYGVDNKVDFKIKLKDCINLKK